MTVKLVPLHIGQKSVKFEHKEMKWWKKYSSLEFLTASKTDALITVRGFCL